MGNIGAAEILVILVVALLVFGPQKLPEIGRQVGQAMRELRRMQASLRDEVRDVLEPVSPATPPKLPSGGAPPLPGDTQPGLPHAQAAPGGEEPESADHTEGEPADSAQPPAPDEAADDVAAERRVPPSNGAGGSPATS